MALAPRQAAMLFFGTSLFGLLTFTSGLMIGVGISGVPVMPALPVAGGAAVAGAKPALAPQTAPNPAPAATAATAAPTPVASVMVPMPQPAPAATATAAGAPAVAGTAAAPAGPAAAAAEAAADGAAPPLAVKDFRVGLPLGVDPGSPLRGPLVDAALVAPRSLLIVPPSAAPAADGAAAQPGTAAPAAAAPAASPAPAPAAAAAAPAPLFMFSVQVGSFLVKGNAERLAAELARRGYPAQVLMAKAPGEPVWYPVVLAPVSDVATVARLAEEFSASEGRHAEIVSWLAGK